MPCSSRCLTHHSRHHHRARRLLSTAVPFKLDSHCNSAVWPICWTIPSPQGWVYAELFLTGHEPNAPIEVSSTEATPIMLDQLVQLKRRPRYHPSGIGGRWKIGLGTYHSNGESSETSLSRVRSGTEKRAARCQKKRKSSRDSGVVQESHSEKRFLLGLENLLNFLEMRSDRAVCGARVCSNKIIWSWISYEEASWGTQRLFVVWSAIWAGKARNEGTVRRQSSSWITHQLHSQRMELYQMNQ